MIWKECGSHAATVEDDMSQLCLICVRSGLWLKYLNISRENLQSVHAELKNDILS